MRRTLMVLLMAAGGCDPEEIEHEAGTDDGADSAEATYPTRHAEAYCGALFACDPVNTCTEATIPYASEAECVQVERTALEEAVDAAKAGGLTFDPDCVDRLIAQYEEVGCDGDNSLLQRFGEGYGPLTCPPYYGTVPVDEDPCFDIVGSNFTTCGRDLVCDEQTCRSAATNDCGCAEGQVCRPGDVDEPCRDILEIGDTCILPPAEYPGVCPVDSHCAWSSQDGELTGPQACIPSEPLGAACINNVQCASFACENDVCVPASPWLCRGHTAPRRWR